MAEKIEVDLEVKSNLEPTIQNLRELKKQLKETAAGSSEFNKISAQIRDMDDAISDAKATNDDFLGQLENASGPLGMLGQGIRNAERTFSSFNGALKASVIGLIVAVIGGLVKAFQDNEVAMKKLQPLLEGMEKIFQGIFRVVEPLFNILVDLALKALPYVSQAFNVVYSSVTAVFQSLGMLGGAVKKLISGDFSGAWEDAKKSVTSFSKNYDDASKRFVSGTKEMTKAEKEEAEKRAELRKKELERLAELEKKRKEAEEKAREERSKRASDLGKDAEARYDELLKTEADARERNRLALMTDQEKELELIAKNYDDKIAKSKEAGISTVEQEIAKANEINDINLKYQKISYDNEEKASKDKIAIAAAELEQKRAIQEAGLNLASGAVGFLKEVAGKNKAVQKAAIIAENAIAIAKMIMANNAANIGALATPQAIATSGASAAPVIAFNNITTALGVATTLASTAKALQAVGGGSAGGGGSASPSGGAPGSAPQFNVVGATGVNQLAGAISNREQQPVQAYVVANNVTTAQSLDRNIIRSATLG
jgi:chromosome segregation ATPase